MSTLWRRPERELPQSVSAPRRSSSGGRFASPAPLAAALLLLPASGPPRHFVAAYLFISASKYPAPNKKLFSLNKPGNVSFLACNSLIA